MKAHLAFGYLLSGIDLFTLGHDLDGMSGDTLVKKVRASLSRAYPLLDVIETSAGTLAVFVKSSLCSEGAPVAPMEVPLEASDQLEAWARFWWLSVRSRPPRWHLFTSRDGRVAPSKNSEKGEGRG